MNQANQVIIEKIKKLLELASTANENDAERTLAMQKAKDLMIKNSLSEYEISQIEEKDLVIIRKEWSHEALGKQGVPNVINAILGLIPPIFGAHCLVFTTDVERKNVSHYEIVGLASNVEIAIYALDSLMTQGLMSAREEYKKHRTINFGMSFWSGFSIGLDKKFGDLTRSEKGIVPYDKVKEYMKHISDGNAPQADYQNGIGMQAGMNAGMNAEIRKAINTESNGKLLQ